MSICEKHFLRRWGMTGLAGLIALTLCACGRIPQDGSPSNAAGKNLYIQGFGVAGGDTCPPTTFLGYSKTCLHNVSSTATSTADDPCYTTDNSNSGDKAIWAIVKNDSTSKTTATEPENQVIQITNIHVEYEVPDAKMQIPTYDNAKGFTVSPGGGTYCSSIVVFSQGAKDFVNKNRSAFPSNPTSSNYFQVNAKVQAQGYETNGGKSVVTPSAFFTVNVYN